LWIDDDSGLLLRSELVDTDGTKLEIFQFATLTVGGAISDADLAPATRPGANVSRMALESSPRSETRQAVQWRAGWLPDGFTMASWDIRRSPIEARPVQTLMYSDGLAVFSVFIEDVPTGGASDLVSRSGATVAVSQVIDAGSERGSQLVTVVGEIPTATAQRVARSLRYAPP
jgi:sigma-E factor negative regulatory protein RseB